MNQKFVHYQIQNTSSHPEIDRQYYSNYHFGPHFHDKSELIYVIEGELQVTVDGHQESVTEEKFCLVLPWQTHSFLTENTSRSLILVFPNDLIDRFLRDMEPYRFRSQVFEAEPAVRELFLQHLSAEPLPDNYIISGILLSLCHCFLTASKPYPVSPKEKNAALPEMMVYIASHASENITLKSVADSLGYSYHHLSHLFNQSVGMSFPQFLNAHRVFNSLPQLRSTDIPIADIAFEFGFSNIRSFNRNFREFIGVSPSEYRKGRQVIESDDAQSEETGVSTVPADSSTAF